MPTVLPSMTRPVSRMQDVRSIWPSAHRANFLQIAQEAIVSPDIAAWTNQPAVAVMIHVQRVKSVMCMDSVFCPANKIAPVYFGPVHAEEIARGT